MKLKKIISSLCALTLLCSAVPMMPTYAAAENLVSNSTFDYSTGGYITKIGENHSGLLP